LYSALAVPASTVGRSVKARANAPKLRSMEDSVGLREEAVGAAERAGQARVEVERINVQLREANLRLGVATVHAQEAEENAEQENRLKDDFLATVTRAQDAAQRGARMGADGAVEAVDART
jgi:hypothetical protein